MMYSNAYWWLSYDVIKNMTMQIMIIIFKNLKLFESKKRNLWAKDVREFLITGYGDMG